MLGDFFGGLGGGPDPDIVVEEGPNGWWRASGPGASRLDQASGLVELFEIVAERHDPGVLVEVRTGSGAWTATVREIREDYGVEYRDRPVTRMEDTGYDPWYSDF